MSTMQAAQMTEDSKLHELTSIPKPPQPNASSELVQLKVLATGLHRLVRSRFSGKHYTSGTTQKIPGVDGVGETSDGQKVFFLCFKEGGSFAEYINVPRRNTWPLPSGLNPVKAAGLLNPALSSWMALTTRCDELPEHFSVLIMGATSASGRLAVLLARSLGAARVIGCARKEEALKSMDLDDHVVLQDSVTSTDFSSLGHVDVILDYVYGPVVVHLFKSLKPTGRVQYVHIGSLAAYSDPSAIEISLPGFILRGMDLTVRGSGMGSWDLRAVGKAMDRLLQSLLNIGEAEIGVKKLEEVETAWTQLCVDWVNMKAPSTHPFLAALLLTSPAIAAPSTLFSSLDKRAIPSANSALQAVQQCNDSLDQELVSECWDTLKVEQYLIEWGRNTPDCAISHGDGSDCCRATESWSTCFLRLSGTASQRCDQLSTSECSLALLRPATLSSTLDPKVKAPVQYVKNAIVGINSLFTSYSSALSRPDFNTVKEIYDAFKASPSRGVPPLNAALQLPIPLLLGLSILNLTGTTSRDLAKNAALWTGALQSAPQLAQVMFPNSHDNQQQIVLDGLKQTTNSTAQLLAAGLNLTLSDIPTFLAVAQNGHFVGNNQAVLADNAQTDLNVGVKTFVTSRLMQNDGIFATPGDVVAPPSTAVCSSLNGTLCSTTKGKVFYWSPATHRQYELRQKHIPALTLPDLMDKIQNQGWADPELLFDGNYNCTIAGNAGKGIAILNGGGVDVSCVSQLPMYLESESAQNHSSIEVKSSDPPPASRAPTSSSKDGGPDPRLDSTLASLEQPGNADDPSQAQSDPDPPSSAFSNAITPSNLYPTEISCRAAFDAAFYCQSFGGQLNNVYRYGSFRNCSQHWSDFWFCLRTNRGFLGDEEKERRVQKHYQLRELKYKVGPSSEDVWKGRTRMVEGAFEGYLEEERRMASERTKELGNNPPMVRESVS
ncbi:MAG: hypothetical protein Q9212_006528 [Teloschistes hypoglaucus]